MTRQSQYLANADAIDHLVLECGAHGYSRAQIAACIGVGRNTLDRWSKEHPRLAEVLERADTLAQAWWEGRAMDGTANQRIGAAIWGKSMAARFSHDYADRIEQGAIGESARVTEIRWKVVDPQEPDSGR
jgi:hypothetical protein